MFLVIRFKVIERLFNKVALIVREDFQLLKKFLVKHSDTAQLVESCAVVVFIWLGNWIVRFAFDTPSCGQPRMDRNGRWYGTKQCLRLRNKIVVMSFDYTHLCRGLSCLKVE